ncbi:MAG: UDP-N-acetylglucosamine 4,6-dehydratase (inverting) [Planctomycetaceae bacterium]|nr:UDP-N-acetylglucosamine 4,6-dehydratase (inverting) [Planctomycetaceae bacterium]
MSLLEGSNVLITGGTGSFGQKCAEYLLNHAPPRRLVIFSRDEQKHVTMSRTKFPGSKYPQIRYFVGDVRDPARLRRALQGIDYVIHAAAMKHVDVAEYNPTECIRTNIGGAENLIEACLDVGVNRLVALSTDKAAAPINLYGATKLCSDKLFVAANSLSGKGGTRFAVVRYGNVLGSNGSVVPFFQKESPKGVLPITSPEMTRFIITLEQGVKFVLQSFERMSGGEVFVPKIPSTTVLDIAKAVAPQCQTKVIGIRPGEKLHECMVPADEARQTLEFDSYYVIQPTLRYWTDRLPEYVDAGKPCSEGFTYSSDSNSDWLTVAQLRQLISVHCPSVSDSRLPKAA